MDINLDFLTRKRSAKKEPEPEFRVVEEEEMPKVLLQRLTGDDQGTFGSWIYSDEDFSCCAIELPWRDNKTSVSRIPEGDYVCVPWSSKKYSEVFHITDVEGRSAVLTHKGNVAGDALMGYKTHSWGCILLGAKFGVLWNQKAILNSATTVDKFVRLMGKRKFLLQIRDAGSQLPIAA